MTTAAPPSTLFGYPIALPAGCEEASTYTYFLDGAEPAARGRPALLRSSLVVVRAPQEGRKLEHFMDEQRLAMAQKLPTARLAREGRASIGPSTGWEREYHFLADSPLPGVVQWHLTCLRDGFFFLFCVTCPKDRFDRDRRSFKAVIDSWA
jgi:hypothetical protein